MATTTERVELPAVRHEHWCQPTGDRGEVRIEQFLAHRDMPSGRSEVVMRVTRCMECGEASYDPA